MDELVGDEQLVMSVHLIVRLLTLDQPVAVCLRRVYAAREHGLPSASEALIESAYAVQ